MGTPHLVVIGGGLAGLSAGCYARASGLDVTIVEHNIALGGVCTAWQRGPYLVDGCIHWLTGGPFQRVYEELGILPAVHLYTLDEFATYRHAREGWSATIRRDAARMQDEFRALAPEDADAIARLMEGAERVARLDPHVERPPELTELGDRLRDLWTMRHDLPALAQFRQPLARWLGEHVRSRQLRAVLTHVAPPESPTFVLLFILGYLTRGWLSRPIGGTARFRDALIGQFTSMGGRTVLNTTVEEVVVHDGRATGVRVTDGTIVSGDAVISTSSAPETVFRLLAGRYGTAAWQSRVDRWRLFEPIVLASFGVAAPLTDQDATTVLDGIEPLDVGGRKNDMLYLRVYNGDPAFAPSGHAVVQAMLPTTYDWWATRGATYQQEKDRVAGAVLDAIDRHVPGVKSALRMTDMATPLTYWRSARSWRGAYEGWMPDTSVSMHVPKTLVGLDRFYMAGQWVEPGGGVPTATMSGRQAVQLVCADLGLEFAVPVG